MPAVTNQGQLDMNLSCGIDFMFSGVGYLHLTGMIAAGSWERARVMETSSRRTLRGPIDPRSRAILGRASALFQVERNAVHAPPLPTSLPRTVVEDVAEVRVAARAAHLGADHPVRAVLDQFDGVRRDGLGEARPAGARVVLRAAIEERLPQAAQW